MSRGTGWDELYATLGAVVLSSTGRKWWKGYGLKVSPSTPYAVIVLNINKAVELPVVENVVLDSPDVSGNEIQQIPWGSCLIDCEVRFIKSSSSGSALEGAIQFKNSLYLTKRGYDLSDIMGISGGVEIMDISEIFRGDVEPRVHVKFSFWANLSLPYTLDDPNISEIETQEVNITHVNNNLGSTEISVESTKP